jgi:riboflavin biosynthesis pyrimidine reductase
MTADERAVRLWRERFEEFAIEKTRLAISTSLCPYVTEVDGHEENALAIGNEWSMQLFDGPFYASAQRSALLPACSLVFVQSADGNTGAADPGSLGGGDTDKHLIYEGLSRVAADAVMAGGQTARGSDGVFSVWHPELVSLRSSLGLPRHPVQIVVTVRGVDLDGSLLFNVPKISVLLLTSARAAELMHDAITARPWVSAVVMNPPGDLVHGFAQLREIGIARVSCVGGRTLATQLLDARLVDEAYLTTAPGAGGEPGTPLYPRPWRGRLIVRKRGTGNEEGVVFEHVLPA